MPHPPAQMAHTFNAQFRADEWKALSDLSHELRVSRSEVLRRLVLAASRMYFNRIPACATGQACLAPQFWASQQPQPQPTPTMPAPPQIPGGIPNG